MRDPRPRTARRQTEDPRPKTQDPRRRRHEPYMQRPLVMKFGGTSVADEAAIRRLIAHVAAARNAGDRPIVVVSALGGVTNELLRAATVAIDGSGQAESILDGLRARHQTLAAQLASDLRDEVCAAITGQFDELTAVVAAVRTLKDASPRAL